MPDGFQLIGLENGQLTPRPAYYALQTAIKYTKGLDPVNSFNLPVNPDASGFKWLFESEGRKTLACINTLPDDNELAEIFGSSGYEAFGMTGEPFRGTGNNGIVYYVSGFSDVRAIRIITAQDEPGASGLVRGREYSFMFRADTEGVSWHHSGGELPDGLTLYESGLLRGIPEKSGTFIFSIEARREGYIPAEGVQGRKRVLF